MRREEGATETEGPTGTSQIGHGLRRVQRHAALERTVTPAQMTDGLGDDVEVVLEPSTPGQGSCLRYHGSQLGTTEVGETEPRSVVVPRPYGVCS